MKYSQQLIKKIKDPKSLWKGLDYNHIDDWYGAFCPRVDNIIKFFEKNGLSYLGHGRGRIGFDLNNGFVLKFPRNKSGIDQNIKEATLHKEKELYPRCRLFGDSLIMIKVQTLREKFFGTSSLEISTEELIERIKVTPSELNDQELYKLMKEELHDSFQVGIHPKNGRLVIYDFAGIGK